MASKGGPKVIVVTVKGLRSKSVPHGHPAISNASPARGHGFRRVRAGRPARGKDR